MEASFETLIASYIENNVGIATNFLSVALCEHLVDNILMLEANELLQQAGIGNDNKLQQNALVRRDTIYWLDKKHNNIHEDAFFAKIDAFVLYLNQSCYAGIMDYEFHYSLYETDDFYKKHLSIQDLFYVFYFKLIISSQFYNPIININFISIPDDITIIR
ncbi:2OG-Fe(II) oxygenase [Flavobacterium sp.]|uniref:2OG-Fe(II) oxygenase n=1 Tax=Flavobacterium sp. TaxID=239 RepID=UPI002FDB49B0